MSETIQTKHCSKCKQIKSLSEFHKNRSKKDGYQSNCKICHNDYINKYHQTKEGREKNRIKSAIYQKTKKGKSTQCRGQKRHNLRYPKKLKARNAVINAVASGKLPPAKALKCTYCPKPAQEYHHWHGYEPEHWLDVVPTCKECHRNIR